MARRRGFEPLISGSTIRGIKPTMLTPQTAPRCKTVANVTCLVSSLRAANKRLAASSGDAGITRWRHIGKVTKIRMYLLNLLLNTIKYAAQRRVLHIRGVRATVTFRQSESTRPPGEAP